MKRCILVALLIANFSIPAVAAESAPGPEAASSAVVDFISGVKAAIQRHLGRPYVWGATGMKSFDCSGFIWRILYENGVLMKRTTARKFYMMMKPVEKSQEWTFGTLVFFDDLKHVGIIDDPKSFFHAQTSKGTNRSAMNSFWKQKIYGFRKLPTPSEIDFKLFD
jgi:cell wall-associated NlpC family hydrolase